MAFLPLTLFRTALGHPPRIVSGRRIWNDGVDELRRRADGRRESGAFLLGRIQGPVRKIIQFLYYDDVDPSCFARGIVEFDGRKFGLVWRHCRDHGLSVVADVHVHPGHFGQSPSDQQNPIMPDVGHLALIIPDYAAQKRLPGGIGIYEYRGFRQWIDHSARGDRLFHVGWWL